MIRWQTRRAATLPGRRPVAGPRRVGGVSGVEGSLAPGSVLVLYADGDPVERPGVDILIAVSAARGGFVPMTTVQQSMSFQRAVTGSDVLVEAVLTKLGRRTAFADITLSEVDSGALAARASTVYAILG